MPAVLSYKKKIIVRNDLPYKSWNKPISPYKSRMIMNIKEMIKIIEIEKKIMQSNETLDKLHNKKLEKLNHEIEFEKKEIKDLLYRYEKIKHNPKKESKIRNEIDYEREKLEKLQKYIINDRQKELENIQRQITSLERKYLKIYNSNKTELHLKYENTIAAKKLKLNKLFKLPNIIIIYFYIIKKIKINNNYIYIMIFDSTYVNSLKDTILKHFENGLFD
jgi:predicted RNase H-like nuclease (RuvC/YqgF family)